MASRFVVPDRDQSFFEAVSYREALGDDHPVWTVISVVESSDLSRLYARYGEDWGQGGRPALDPAMLAVLVIFGCCEGILSSRSLEEACRRDWAYRAICGDDPPDHSTISRFRQDLDDEVEMLFSHVLAVCAEAGMGELGTVALDGTRMGAAASKEANRTARTLERMEAEAQRMMEEAAAADQADLGDPGDGLDGWSPSRREGESQRWMESLRKAQEAVSEAEERREAEEKKRGRPKSPVGNVTDPDSRLQKTRNGFIQGFNAQAVVTEDQLVIAAEVVPDVTDVGSFGPMISATQTNLTRAGMSPAAGVWLADAGYWSEANASLGESLGIDALIATTKTRRVGEVPAPSDAKIEQDRKRLGVVRRIDAGEMTVTAAARQLDLSPSYVSKLLSRYRQYGDLDSSATHARREMEAKLAEPDNQDRYRKRGWMIEGSFAHTKVHRNSSRFLRRGIAAVDAEWKLMNLAGNIMKLHRHLQKHKPDPSDRCGLEPTLCLSRRSRRRYRPHQRHTAQHRCPKPVNQQIRPPHRNQRPTQ